MFVFTVSTSCLPWFRSEAFGHITDAILHVDTARFSFFPSVITVASEQLLSGPRFRTRIHPTFLPSTLFVKIASS
jgi:hypothetical protein